MWSDGSKRKTTVESHIRAKTYGVHYILLGERRVTLRRGLIDLSRILKPGKKYSRKPNGGGSKGRKREWKPAHNQDPKGKRMPGIVLNNRFGPLSSDEDAST